MAKKPIEVETLTHDATRKNIPTAEFESIMREQDKTPIQLAYERRNRDLDPQLVWRGKDAQDWSDLIVQAPPLYIQEKVHPKVIIDDLKRESANRAKATKDAPQFDMFADFNGLPDAEAATEFYQHDQHWSNRMISGDSLSVMASLAEREGLRGQVQCIYFDPPYGIKFNSNFQWSTTTKDVKDGDKTHVTREPEQVRAFRDTWKDGIHSYLTYLRDRLTVARDLLSDSGSIFVQIGDENVHRVRALMEEVFGEDNFVAAINYVTTSGRQDRFIDNISNHIVWFAKRADQAKYRQLYMDRANYSSEFIADQLQSDGLRKDGDFAITVEGRTFKPKAGNHWKVRRDGAERVGKSDRLIPQKAMVRYKRFGADFSVRAMPSIWLDTSGGAGNDKIYVVQSNVRLVERCILMTTDPGDLVLDPTCGSGTTAYAAEQWGRRWITIDTSRVAIALARSRLMGARYPYYLLADSKEGQAKEGEITRTPPKSAPTHGSIRQGFVYDRVPHITLKSIANNAEIDVIWNRMQPAVEEALANLNECMLGFPCQHRITTGGRTGKKLDFTEEGEVVLPSGEEAPTHGFMEWEVPRQPASPMNGELKSYFDSLHRIFFRPGPRGLRTNDPAAISQRFEALSPDEQYTVTNLIDALNETMAGGTSNYRIGHPGIWFGLDNVFSLPEGEEGLIVPWPIEAVQYLNQFWAARIARQREIDASIAAKAEFEFLYDKPFTDSGKTRVAGPFTVESLSPHRTLAVDWDDELIDTYEAAEGRRKKAERGDSFTDFAHMILENLKAAGVQQAHKEDRITFTALTGWPGTYISAEGTFMEGDTQRRAGVFIGPEFGTVSRPDLVAAAREAGDAGFDVLIACAFNYDAHSSEFDKLGRIRVLKARMNPDLHMAADLKATGAGNLFVIFGEPDIRHVVGATSGCAEEIERRHKRNDAITQTVASLKHEKDDKSKELAARLNAEHAKNLRFVASATALPEGQVLVEIWGVDVFKPQTGEVQSESTDGIALWMLDIDYNEESFFVRHAYFLGANDPYKALKTTLKAEIDEEAWESLYSDTSRPFAKPKSGRIAVKVINHLGDEVMKVFAVE